LPETALLHESDISRLCSEIYTKSDYFSSKLFIVYTVNTTITIFLNHATKHRKPKTNILNCDKVAISIMSETRNVSEEKKQVVMNLYVSGIGEEFIAMQLDLEIPLIISILKELNVYKGTETAEEK